MLSMQAPSALRAPVRGLARQPAAPGSVPPRPQRRQRVAPSASALPAAAWGAPVPQRDAAACGQWRAPRAPGGGASPLACRAGLVPEQAGPTIPDALPEGEQVNLARVSGADPAAGRGGRAGAAVAAAPRAPLAIAQRAARAWKRRAAPAAPCCHCPAAPAPLPGSPIPAPPSRPAPPCPTLPRPTRNATAPPPGLRIEPVPDTAQSDVEYDAASNTVRIPLNATDGGRRTKLVMFTCNKCGAWARRGLGGGRRGRLTGP
jgi:hypothetical protein